MKCCPIVLFPEKVLRIEAAAVSVFGPELMDLISRMQAAMKSQKHGIGIAAPQIGVSQAVALVDVSGRVQNAKGRVLVNPKIINHSKEKVISREGCMSLPDYMADLNRWEWVEVSWQDEKGSVHRGTYSGIEGICMQHEIDHLHGKLFLDRVACLKTDMFARHLKKSRKKQ